MTRGRPERPGGRVPGLPGPRRGTRMRDITVSKARASPAWPAVTVKARGRARPSAARWTLVLNPPRERPRHDRRARRSGPPPFGCSGGVLVGPDDRGVHRHRPVDVVVGVRRCQDGGENRLPGAVDGPSDQPPVRSLERAEFLGQVPPERVGAVLPREGLKSAAAHRPPRTGSAGISGSIMSDRTGRAMSSPAAAPPGG